MALLVYEAIMIRSQIQFDEATYLKLRTAAKESGESISSIARHSVEHGLDKGAKYQAWARALSSIGKFDSGLRDLAEKHDQYLEERW
jgi:hypothetical protein